MARACAGQNADSAFRTIAPRARLKDKAFRVASEARLRVSRVRGVLGSILRARSALHKVREEHCSTHRG